MIINQLRDNIFCVKCGLTKKPNLITLSSNMLEALKSRNITFFSVVCKNASPLAAPIAILILVSQGKVSAASSGNVIHEYVFTYK